MAFGKDLFDSRVPKFQMALTKSLITINHHTHSPISSMTTLQPLLQQGLVNSTILRELRSDKEKTPRWVRHVRNLLGRKKEKGEPSASTLASVFPALIAALITLISCLPTTQQPETGRFRSQKVLGDEFPEPQGRGAGGQC